METGASLVRAVSNQIYTCIIEISIVYNFHLFILVYTEVMYNYTYSFHIHPVIEIWLILKIFNFCCFALWLVLLKMKSKAVMGNGWQYNQQQHFLCMKSICFIVNMVIMFV